jgi:hypothetical protein
MREEHRRALALFFTVGGWLASFGLALYATLNYNPSQGKFAPQWVTLSVFLSMGVAIAGGVALGRLRSVQVLTKVFQAGIIADGKDGEHGEDEPR